MEALKDIKTRLTKLNFRCSDCDSIIIIRFVKAVSLKYTILRWDRLRNFPWHKNYYKLPKIYGNVSYLQKNVHSEYVYFYFVYTGKKFVS